MTFVLLLLLKQAKHSLVLMNHDLCVYDSVLNQFKNRIFISCNRSISHIYSFIFRYEHYTVGKRLHLDKNVFLTDIFLKGE